MLEVLGQVLAAAVQELAAGGLAHGTAASASAADLATGSLLVTAAGQPAREAAPHGAAELDLETGAHLDGPLPSADVEAHRALALAGHEAVVMATAPHASALALLLDEVPCVLEDQLRAAGGAAPVLAHAPAGSAALGHAVAAALAPGAPGAALVRHVGLVAVGPDIASALAAALATEAGARVALLARAAGGGAPPTLG